IIVAIGILTMLSVFVIPKFREVFMELTGGNLPLFTEYVLNSSRLIKDNMVWIVAVMGTVVGTYKLVQLHRSGRFFVDRIKLRLPVVGRINRKVAIARLARILGTLLQNGVPILQALNIARATTSNIILADALQYTHNRVQDGDSLCDPLRVSGVFPSTVLSMIDVGEQSGALPQMLLKIADGYEDEVDNAVAAAMSLLEPLLIIFLAFVVGAVVIALLLPIKRIIERGFDGM